MNFTYQSGLTSDGKPSMCENLNDIPRICTCCPLIYVTRFIHLVLTKQRNWFIQSMKNRWSTESNEILLVDLKKPGWSKSVKKNSDVDNHSITLRYRYIVSKSPFVGGVEVNVWSWSMESGTNRVIFGCKMKLVVHWCGYFVLNWCPGIFGFIRLGEDSIWWTW